MRYQIGDVVMPRHVTRKWRRPSIVLERKIDRGDATTRHWYRILTGMNKRWIKEGHLDPLK